MMFSHKEKYKYEIVYEHRKAVLIYDETRIQLYARFLKSSSQVNMITTNDYNKTYLFCTAYIDDEGNGVIRSNFSFVGGATNISLAKFINNFGSSIREFQHLLK